MDARHSVGVVPPESSKRGWRRPPRTIFGQAEPFTVAGYVITHQIVDLMFGISTRRFALAGPDERLLLAISLAPSSDNLKRRLRSGNIQAFLDLRNQVAAEAAANGLTEKRLNELLADDDV